MRGGIECVDGGDGGLGKMVPLRKRFGLPHTGLTTFIMDTLCYCFCAPCVATQEYRQVMELLSRGVQEETAAVPASAADAGAPVIIGQAVEVNEVIIGQTRAAN